jgi:hypothetical protein
MLKLPFIEFDENLHGNLGPAPLLYRFPLLRMDQIAGDERSFKSLSKA